MKTKLKLRTHHKKNQKSKRSTVSKKNVKRTQDGGESSLNNFRKYILYDIIDYLGPSLYYTRIQHSESQKEVRLKKNLISTPNQKYLLQLQHQLIIELKDALFPMLELKDSTKLDSKFKNPDLKPYSELFPTSIKLDV